MASQTHDLHRALLRPFVIHTLRAAGFHSTKPSVLDTLVNLAERYLILLASTTATYARNNSSGGGPGDSGTATLADARAALTDCGALTPVLGAAEQQWAETLRQPAAAMPAPAAEKRKRDDDDDLADIRPFVAWFEGPAFGEIRRVAGLVPDLSGGGGGVAAAGPAGIGATAATETAVATATAAAAVTGVGVGGGVVQAEDFLTALKKKQGKAGADESRWQGTVLGRAAEERSVLLEGGPVQRIGDWKPPRQTVVPLDKAAGADDEEARPQNGESNGLDLESDASSPLTVLGDDDMPIQ